MLDLVELSKLRPLRDFIEAKLETRPQFQLYYNFDFNMLDVKGINTTTSDTITISFRYDDPKPTSMIHGWNQPTEGVYAGAAGEHRVAQVDLEGGFDVVDSELEDEEQ